MKQEKGKRDIYWVVERHTAGLALIRVRGKSLVPAPPPSISEATDLGSASELRKLGSSSVCTERQKEIKIRFLDYSYIRKNVSLKQFTDR